MMALKTYLEEVLWKSQSSLHLHQDNSCQTLSALESPGEFIIKVPQKKTNFVEHSILC